VIDLDELDERATAVRSSGVFRQLHMDPEEIQAVVAELRVAREVVVAARRAVPVHVGTTKALGRLQEAVRAYYKAVG
jgi:hypothetical protein